MDNQQSMVNTMTKKQSIALRKLYDRNNDGSKSFDDFWKRATQSVFAIDHVIFIKWCDMTVGIETDGHAHT